jgi:hypothetical protein
MNSPSRSLVLENYFPSGPNGSFACVDNSADLLRVLGVCHTAAGNRWSNFVAVDFYMVFCLSTLSEVLMFFAVTSIYNRVK